MGTVGRMSAPRIIVLLLFLAALASSAVGFLWYSGASMPYPDPSPELLTKQSDDMQNALTVFFVGLIVAVASGVWLWKTRNTPH
jgi:hypothetical protein